MMLIFASSTSVFPSAVNELSYLHTFFFEISVSIEILASLFSVFLAMQLLGYSKNSNRELRNH